MTVSHTSFEIKLLPSLFGAANKSFGQKFAVLETFFVAHVKTIPLLVLTSQIVICRFHCLSQAA